jgi:dipeptidyl aminopeptidase/acylaminoacyl peptidase
MNADGSGRTQLTQGGRVSMFGWAPDGQRIAVVRGLVSAADPERATDVALLSLASRIEIPLLADLAADVRSIAWTPDRTRLALMTDNWPDNTGRLLEVDASTGAMSVLDRWALPGMGVGMPFWTSGVAWAPDGNALLVYKYPAETKILILNAGAVTRTAYLAGSKSIGSLRERNCLCPQWSPDGSLIACHDFDSTLVVTPDAYLVSNSQYGKCGIIRGDGCRKRE